MLISSHGVGASREEERGGAAAAAEPPHVRLLAGVRRVGAQQLHQERRRRRRRRLGGAAVVAVLPPERVARLEVPPRDVRGAGGALGVAAKASAAYHGGRSSASWRPQGSPPRRRSAPRVGGHRAGVRGGVQEIHDAAAAGRRRRARWRMRALEGLTVTLAFTQLLYVLLLHAAVAGERCGLACAADA